MCEREGERERERKRERECVRMCKRPKEGLLKRALLKRLYSAKETYNLKEPTNRPSDSTWVSMCEKERERVCLCVCVCVCVCVCAKGLTDLSSF